MSMKGTKGWEKNTWRQQVRMNSLSTLKIHVKVNKLLVVSCSLNFIDDIDCHLKAQPNRMFGDNSINSMYAYKRIIDVFLLLTFYNGKRSDLTHQYIDNLISRCENRLWCSISIHTSVTLAISLMDQMGN